MSDRANIADITNFSPPHNSTQMDVDDDNNAAAAASVSSAGRGSNIRKYKNLITKIRNRDFESSADFTNLEKEAMVEMMKEAQQLYKTSNTANELQYDAQIIKQMSKICRQYAEEISLSTVRFHPMEFASKMATDIRGNNFNEDIPDEAWVRFGNKALMAFVRTTSLQSLFSAFPDNVEAPPKERVKKESNKVRGTKGEATKANVVDMNKSGQTAAGSNNDTDKLVTKVFKQLVVAYNQNDTEAPWYFQFVIDPNDFGSTVENIFYVSFLVKEGRVRIFYDRETGLPKIMPMKKKNQDPSMAPAENLANKKQVIVPFSTADWQRHIKAMNITEAMIKR